jgi:peptidyl-Lys metalloendopeptidase
VKHSYNFTSTGEGAYNFAVRDTPFYIIAPTKEVATLHAKQETSSAKLTGNLVLPRAVEPLQKRATFRGCSSSQQSNLNTAASNAQSYAASALS